MRCPYCKLQAGTTHHPRVGTFCVACLRTIHPTPRRQRAGKHTRRLLKVAMRDHWVCWLCHQPVDPEGVGAAAPTKDHVKTASRGGTRTYDNLRLAHYACNHQRGDHPCP